MSDDIDFKERTEVTVKTRDGVDLVMTFEMRLTQPLNDIPKKYRARVREEFFAWAKQAIERGSVV